MSVIPILLGEVEGERKRPRKKERWARLVNKKDDTKIIGKSDVGGRTGWDEDRMPETGSDKEREWELIGGWMDRQDDEKESPDKEITGGLSRAEEIDDDKVVKERKAVIDCA